MAPIEGRGYVDLKIRTLLVEPNLYAWKVRINDGATGQQLDIIPRVRFVVTELEPVLGFFGLTHDWEQPVNEGVPPGAESRGDAREQAA